MTRAILNRYKGALIGLLLVATQCEAKMKWAVLGTTKIAETMVEAINEAGGEVVSVYTKTNFQRLTNFADKYQISHRFLSIDEAIAVDGVKAVWVGTPNQAHADACLRAFANDNIEIVLSEKSLERDMDGARKIENGLQAAIASRKMRGVETPLIFREAIFYLNHPIIKKFYTVLQTNILGEVKSINAEYSRDLSKYTNGDGGGAIYNLGVYPISLVRLAMGAVFGEEEREKFSERQIRAFAHIQSDKLSTDSSMSPPYVARSTAMINFANGVRASITACEVSKGEHSDSFEIIGSKGRIIFRTNPYSPERGLPNQFDFIDGEGKITSFSETTERGAYAYQIEMTMRDLADRRETAIRPCATLTDSMAIMKFLCDWEEKAVGNPESCSGKLDELKQKIFSEAQKQ